MAYDGGGTQSVSSERLLRLRQVQELVPLAKGTIYGMIQLGQFPRPVQLGRQCVAWRLSEIEHWIRSRPPTGTIPGHGNCTYSATAPRARRAR